MLLLLVEHLLLVLPSGVEPFDLFSIKVFEGVDADDDGQRV